MTDVQFCPCYDLQNKYTEISRLVKENNPVVITNSGVGDTVLISIEEYSKFEDYMHRMYIMEELKKSGRRSRRPQYKVVYS